MIATDQTADFGRLISVAQGQTQVGEPKVDEHAQ
jgi:hypothetical protein